MKIANTHTEMNKSLDTSPGAPNRCRPQSSLFSLVHMPGPTPITEYARPVPSSGPTPTLQRETSEKRAWSCEDVFHPSPNHVFLPAAYTSRTSPTASSKPRLPRLSTSCFPDFSLSTTLPPPYPTLPPPSIPHPPPPHQFTSPSPLFSLPPSLPPLADDRLRMSSFRPVNGRPQVTNCNNSSQSPTGGRVVIPPNRRSSSPDTTSRRPLTPHSRRSSQASARTNMRSIEYSKAGFFSSPASVKIEAASTPLTKPRESKPLPVYSVVQIPVKSRRVRTGCLTCRERHLKCDEGVPDCLNCRKGKRECKRGLRLNFIDTQIKEIPDTSPVSEWNVSFLDESRLIASEYAGGLSRYPRVDMDTSTPPVPDRESPTLKRRRLERDEKPGNENNKISHTTTSTPTLPWKNNPGHADANIALPTALTQEMVKSVLVAGIGINENGCFGLMPDKENANKHKHVPSPSDVLSISSSMAPQGLESPSVSSNHSEADSSPKGQESTKQRHDTMPDALPTPPSENPSMSKCETEFGIDVDFRGFGNCSSVGQCEKEYLNTPDEILFMQSFVKGVGVRMDSLDKHNHFSQVVPFLALRSPMLLNAFLACGVKQMIMTSRTYNDEKALYYHDTATAQLLRSLENPDRNIAECATTSVVLSVYENMSNKSNERTSHIAGARALIRECGWDARSEGIGAACFWLNIGMEVMSCLTFDWSIAWDPDQWGLDLGFFNDLASCHDGDGSVSQLHCRKAADVGNCDEELWVKRIFYILAKVVNFRASMILAQEASTHDDQMRLHSRFSEWKKLKDLCDGWNHSCPRVMKPLSYLSSSQNTASSSVFPNVWLLERMAINGRLFYHTAMILLHQINPLKASGSRENQKTQVQHARQVCGIIAHTNDRGIVGAANRSLLISAAVLQDQREQDEAISLLHRIATESGWCMGKALEDLYAAWGRDYNGRNFVSGSLPHFRQTSSLNDGGATTDHHHLYLHSTAPVIPNISAPDVAPSARSFPHIPPVPPKQQRMTNPLLDADFSLPDRPYKAFYCPPSETTPFNTQAF